MVVVNRRVLSSAAATVSQQGGGQGGSTNRLDSLRARLRDEEDSISTTVKLQDFSFSGNVSYGTAVPKRTRDKSGKVRWYADR